MAARAARLRAGRSAPGMPPPAATCHERSPSQLAQLLLILSSLIGENSTVQSHDSQADCNSAAEELPAAAVDGGAVAADVLADNCGADGAADRAHHGRDGAHDAVRPGARQADVASSAGNSSDDVSMGRNSAHASAHAASSSATAATSASDHHEQQSNAPQAGGAPLALPRIVGNGPELGIRLALSEGVRHLSVMLVAILVVAKL